MSAATSFADLLGGDLSVVVAGAEAAGKRAVAAEQYGAALKSAPALDAWTGAASDKARALVDAMAAHSDAVAVQARSLVGPLLDYATRGEALKAAAQSLVHEAAAHGYQIGPDGSITAAAPQKGLYARAIAKQLADKTGGLLVQDKHNSQNLARAIHAALNPDSGKAGH
ncbi:MAG: hypothetical protein ACRC20_12560 [Segniliparus sp.]|uniref:hypothetical protein n=1 Tax=Segniliparus sp. TaxID=2804064 RepID=UPI003F3095D8